MKIQKSPATRFPKGKVIAFSALGAYFAILLAGGLLALGKESILSPKFIIYINPWVYAGAWAVVTAILTLYGWISPKVVYGFTWLASLGYALFAAVAGGSYYLTFAMCGVVAVTTCLCGRALRAEAEKSPAPAKAKRSGLSEAALKVLLVVGTVILGSGTLFLLVSSYLSYVTQPSTNTGIYVQLLHALRSGFSFNTTVEFGETVSHMAAHISPIFLLYLPFYALIPSPVTVMVLQVAAVCSAVIPLWLIAGKRGISPAGRVLLCLLLCAFPVVWGGAAGSIHEYALLLPLLLWLFWSLESNKTVLTFLFAALILCVGETCSIHLFTVALYWLIRNRKSTDTAECSHKSRRTTGLILLGVSLAYFVVTTVLLTHLGKGTLITRFGNVTGIYATDFDTLFRAIIFNPALAFYEVLAEAKLHFVLLITLPLALIPFFSKKKAGLVFLFPLVIMNLLADFTYHYSPDYPFAFGIAAYAFYVATDGLGELESRVDRPLLTKRLAVLAACFTLIVGGFRVADYGMFISYAVEGKTEIAAMDELVELVEEDASVSVSARLLPNLAARDEVYLLSHEKDTTYVVLDLRDEWGIPGEAKFTTEFYTGKGYAVVKLTEGVGAVLKKG